VSHNITSYLKMFGQKSYALFLFIFILFLFFCNFDAYRKNKIPLLHKVVLHYKIIPACNTWNSWIVPTVIHHLHAPLKSRTSFYARKVQIFSTFIRYSTLLTKGILKRKWSLLRPKTKFFVSYLTAKPFHCSWNCILPFVWPQPNMCIADEIDCSFVCVYCEFEYRTFISSYNGNETSWKKCDVSLCILGCFRESHTNARFS
jgi:hypothetical protein